MPFVQIPKDLSKIRTKIAFGLGKRQLICFGSGAVIGLPAYFFIRNIIGNTFALVLMIIIMSPLFLLGIYEKDGQPAEKVVINFLRLRLYYKGIRLYKTENFYETIEMIEKTDKNNNMGGGYVGAKKSSKPKKSGK